MEKKMCYIEFCATLFYTVQNNNIGFDGVYMHILGISPIKQNYCCLHYYFIRFLHSLFLSVSLLVIQSKSFHYVSGSSFTKRQQKQQLSANVSIYQESYTKYCSETIKKLYTCQGNKQQGNEQQVKLQQEAQKICQSKVIKITMFPHSLPYHQNSH